MNQNIQWQIKKVKVSELKEWDKNPRKITEQGLKDLVESIKKFGVAEPIIINHENVICGGHGRKLALTQLGVEYADCYSPATQLTDKQFEELNVRLNKNIAGEWDTEKLTVNFEMDDLLEWGFDTSDFAKIELKVDDIDEVKEDNEVKIKHCPHCGKELA